MQIPIARGIRVMLSPYQNPCEYWCLNGMLSFFGIALMSGVWGINCVRSLLHKSVRSRSQLLAIDRSGAFIPYFCVACRKCVSSSKCDRDTWFCWCAVFLHVQYVLRGVWTTVDMARYNFRGKKQGFPSEGFGWRLLTFKNHTIQHGSQCKAWFDARCFLISNIALAYSGAYTYLRNMVHA